jgi:hypothetical protein
MVAGYAGTLSDVIGSTRVAGDRVIVWLSAHENGGVTQTYEVAYTVKNGVITAGRILASYSAPTGNVSPASDPRSPPSPPARIWPDRIWSDPASSDLSRPACPVRRPQLTLKDLA